MKLKEVIERIRFNTSTQSHLSGKGIGEVFSDRNIMQQLKFALDRYASYTQAIQSVYSIPLETDVETLSPPPLALRTRAYRFALIWIDQVKYPIDSPTLSRNETVFDYQPIQGIPNWFVHWGDEITLHPSASSTFQSTTLDGAITAVSTSITLTDATNFPLYRGRITIGDEKIRYETRTGNVLTGLKRGAEQTTAAAHVDDVAVKENNLWFFYFKLHDIFTVSSENFLTSEQLNTEMEICDEHVEVVADQVSYLLLKRIPGSNSEVYNRDYDKWLDKAKWEISRGRPDISKTGLINVPELWESGIPYWQL